MNSYELSRSVSDNETLTIEAQDGQNTIMKAASIFTVIDPYFQRLEQAKPQRTAREIEVEMREMIASGNLIQIFITIDFNLKRLIMTQSQIVRFCEKYRDKLTREGQATFFLTFINGEYFVIRVYVHQAGGLGVAPYRIGATHAWDNRFCRRIVVPKQLLNTGFVASSLVSRTIIPATTKPFMAREKFVVDTSSTARVKISYLDDEFQARFLDKAEGLFLGSTMVCHQLDEDSTDQDIARMVSKKKAVPILTELYEMLIRQPAGQPGDLLTDGSTNIFPIYDIDNILAIVIVYWSGNGWNLETSSPKDAYSREAGNQVFIKHR